MNHCATTLLPAMPARRWASAAISILWLATSPATAGILFRDAVGLGLEIPDGSLAGLVHSLSITGAPSQPIASVRVGLELSDPGNDGFLGDLYVTLLHDTGYTVLLNRPGRTSANPFGYSDGGPVEIVFADDALRDVHNYRSELAGGGVGSPLAGALTGVWAPTGRTTDPLLVLDTDARPSGLGNLAGLNANGSWALFLADVSSGGSYQLDGWSLEIVLVPEPATGAATLAVGLLAWVYIRRR